MENNVKIQNQRNLPLKEKTTPISGPSWEDTG